jgi:hypothetical protein
LVQRIKYLRLQGFYFLESKFEGSAELRFGFFKVSIDTLKNPNLYPKNESSAAEDVVTEEYLLLQMNLFFWCR